MEGTNIILNFMIISILLLSASINCHPDGTPMDGAGTPTEPHRE